MAVLNKILQYNSDQIKSK